MGRRQARSIGAEKTRLRHSRRHTFIFLAGGSAVAARRAFAAFLRSSMIAPTRRALPPSHTQLMLSVVVLRPRIPMEATDKGRLTAREGQRIREVERRLDRSWLYDLRARRVRSTRARRDPSVTRPVPPSQRGPGAGMGFCGRSATARCRSTVGRESMEATTCPSRRRFHRDRALPETAAAPPARVAG